MKAYFFKTTTKHEQSQASFLSENGSIRYLINRVLIALIALVPIFFTGCDKDSWSEGDSAYEHIYYFGFEDWGKLKNDVKFTVNKASTIAIPVQFQSERVRNYDVETFYYVTGAAIPGTDYQIVDSTGVELTPGSNGAFSMTWPKAVKGVKNIYVKALNGAAATFQLQTFDPNAAVPISNSDVSTTTCNKTDQYEVRAYSQNYFVTVTIK